MSKRTLRPEKNQTKMSPIKIESNDEDESDCSTIGLKKSPDSDVEYIPSSDSEVLVKRKKIGTGNKKITKKMKLEPSTSIELSDSDDEASPKEKQKLSDEKPTKPNKKISTGNKKLTKNMKLEPSTSIELSDSDDEASPKKKQKLFDEKPKKPKKKTKAKSKAQPKVKIRSIGGDNIKFEWREEDLLAEKENLNKNVARSIVQLFQEGNTIPFIARYRKHLTGDMDPENIRHMKECYDDLVELKTKSCSVLKTILKNEKLTPDLQKSILSCKSLEELEHIYAPYKEINKKSLAERAKQLGLEEPAIHLLNGTKEININSLIQTSGPKGLNTRAEVEKNLVHIIGHTIAHHSEVLTYLRELKDSLHIKIATKLSSTSKNNQDDENVAKFQNYFDNQFNVRTIQPHQVLAINRAESLKVITVKVVVPDYLFYKLKYFCEKKWMNNANRNSDRYRIFQDTLKEIYSKSITPFIGRKVRSDLKTIAHKASIEVFAKNLKQLLLEPPVKGKCILGIDPGLKLGCKIALISPLSEVLDTAVIYPHTQKKSIKDAEFVKNFLIKHKCTLIAIGNGKACRETESWLTDLIKSDYFKPLDISYTIVDESGASVYSVSDEAKKEFPNLDPLIISAISLARRIQDPLAELVKIEPKSLGVGMYQHDLNQKLLDSTLNEVISECVSFVGVDLNTASYCLLRRVAGLTAQRAESIITFRQKNGPFTNRYQVKDVKGIGDKVFEQCSGFLRIMPSNSSAAVEFYKKPETTPLDATDIHPETYVIAEKILEKLGLFYKHIGQPDFIKSFKSKIQSISVVKLAKNYNTTEQTINLIIDALSKPLAYDLRSENTQGPMFKKNVTSIADLKQGISLTGRVTNVVHFGAFVDIGVGKCGLIHNSRMKGKEILLGQRVQVRVLNVENNGAKIGLEIENILS